MSLVPTRRDFMKTLAVGGAAAVCAPHIQAFSPLPPGPADGDEKPGTNIADALKIPRTENSMPGRYPGGVIEVHHPGCLVSEKPDQEQAGRMVERGMLELTGESTIEKAWLQFVSPEDVIGLKVNPVAGKLLSTSPEIVAAIVAQLTSAGIPASNIVIWDRREFQLHETGFTAERFPGIAIKGTEYKDDKGAFFDASGKPYGERRIDKDLYYWADCEQEYDKETLPYMINEGKYSYFSTIATKDITKIINIPILKNAGSTVTLCLKNLAYGAISNTARLHKALWSETTAEVPCFAPLRDKTVLNIVDGMIGCYQGGPGANPEFITAYNTMLFGTDPVAVDRIGYEIVLQKRLETEIQKKESPRAIQFMTLAAKYGLGVADKAAIVNQRIEMSA